MIANGPRLWPVFPTEEIVHGERCGIFLKMRSGFQLLTKMMWGYFAGADCLTFSWNGQASQGVWNVLKVKPQIFLHMEISFLVQIGTDVITVLQGIFQSPIVRKWLHRWKDSSCEEYFLFDRSSSFPFLLKIQYGAPDIAIPGSGESLWRLLNVNVFQQEKWTTFPQFHSRSETPENVFHLYPNRNFWNIYNRQQNCWDIVLK